jgi:hypothetical protein
VRFTAFLGGVDVQQTGRPNRLLHASRTKRFFQLVTAGERFDEAGTVSGLSDKSVLRLLSDLGFDGIAALEPEREAEAA